MSRAELNGQLERHSGTLSIIGFTLFLFEWFFEPIGLRVSHVLWDNGLVELFTRHEVERHYRFT